MNSPLLPNLQNDTDQAFERLVHWVEAAGGKVSPLALLPKPGGDRGLFATTRIPSQRPILRVPHSCLLTVEMALGLPIGQAFAATGLVPRTSHTWLASLLLTVLFDRATPFRPYLDLLPQSYPFMPLLFEDHDLALLRGSFTYGRIAERKENIQREYEYLTRLVPALRVYTFAQFVWARLTVLSRNFGITVDGAKTQALVPIADLLNHQHPREANWGYVGQAGEFAVTALCDFSKGDEVRDSYGRKCNSRFFMNYGFVLAENEENEAKLTFDTPRGPETFLVSAHPEAQSMQKMLLFLQQSSPHPSGPKQRDNVRRRLVEACEQALGAFDTTLAEDETLLANPLIQGNARTCIMMRRGEKRVLHALLDWTRM